MALVIEEISAVVAPQEPPAASAAQATSPEEGAAAGSRELRREARMHARRRERLFAD